MRIILLLSVSLHVCVCARACVYIPLWSEVEFVSRRNSASITLGLVGIMKKRLVSSVVFTVSSTEISAGNVGNSHPLQSTTTRQEHQSHPDYLDRNTSIQHWNADKRKWAWAMMIIVTDDGPNVMSYVPSAKQILWPTTIKYRYNIGRSVVKKTSLFARFMTTRDYLLLNTRSLSKSC